jgi:hypothetical protein
MKLVNRADGVDGHYCIGRNLKDFREYWNDETGRWGAFGTVFEGKEFAEKKFNEIISGEFSRDAIDRAIEAFVK